MSEQEMITKLINSNAEYKKATRRSRRAPKKEAAAVVAAPVVEEAPAVEEPKAEATEEKTEE